MAVIVEMLSVVVRRDAIDRAYRGGWDVYSKTPVPNLTLCSDGELIRIGFMALDDAKAYISTLEAAGLTFHRDGQAVDLALVHQKRGLALPAPWLEVGTLHLSGRPVVACWLAGGQPGSLAVPPGWKYEESASHLPFFEGEADGDRVKFLRSDGAMDVYLDLLSGKEVFVGRAAVDGDTEAALATQLERICKDALNIDAQCVPLRELRDEAGVAPLFNRLHGELLPAVERIIQGPGREMAFAHFARGLILRILDRQPEAESSFRIANLLRPGFINTLLELVRCLGEQGKPHEALPFAREATEVEPVDPSAWGNLAMCLIKCGDREEARKAIDFAIDLDPKDPVNRYIRDNFENYFQ